MASKHKFKTQFGIVLSRVIKIMFNCSFIYYYDEKSIISTKFYSKTERGSCEGVV